MVDDLAAHLAPAMQSIEHMPFKDPAALMRAARRSSALVLAAAAPVTDVEVGEGLDALVATLPCPVYVVRSVGVPRRAAQPAPELA